MKNNILYVASGDENKYLYSSRAIIGGFNLLSDRIPDKCGVKFRYRQQDIDCSVKVINDKTLELNYTDAKAVTPGQFCVLYNGEECIGGGIIEKVYK